MEFCGVFVMGCHVEPDENLKPGKAIRAQLEPQPHYLNFPPGTFGAVPLTIITKVLLMKAKKILLVLCF